jgi:hypothetical protein
MPDDINVEQTIANIEKYGEANPKELESAPPPAEEKPFLTFKNQDDFLKHEFEYKADQKQVKEDLATILKRAQQGYHYAQNMQKLNSEREAFDGERKTLTQQMQEAQALNQKWSKFEQYAQQNPQWYDHWNSAWETRDQQQAQTNGDDFSQKLEAALADKLKPFEELLAERQQVKQSAMMAENDRALDDQIKSIRTNYKDIDFDRTDPETGKSLEYEVLEWMQQNGVTNFSHAFKAYYHDNLVKMEIERQKESEQKALAEKKKKGILDEKIIPGSKPAGAMKGKSWDQIAQTAAREYGIA